MSLEPETFVVPSSACAACKARGKTWNGSDPKCSFPNGGEFTSEGWNCATAELIRELCPRFEKAESVRVSGPFWNEDQYWAAIDLRCIELTRGNALTLWISWYKGRGRTDEMWLLSDNDAPWRPDEDDIIQIASMIARETAAPPNAKKAPEAEAPSAR